MTVHLCCIVPFCKNVFKGEAEQESEWICDKHFMTIPATLRKEYNSAHLAATEADKRKSDDWSIYQRVEKAFSECVRIAIEKAADI